MKVTLLSAIGIFWLACIAFVAWLFAGEEKKSDKKFIDKMQRWGGD